LNFDVKRKPVAQTEATEKAKKEGTGGPLFA
jgi:hypothetical protein